MERVSRIQLQTHGNFLKKSNRYNLICVVFLHLLLKGFRRKKNSFFSDGNEVLVAVCIS